MRFIWTISVVGFLCMAMVQVVVLTMEFRQYKTYTSTGEVFINVFDPDEAMFYSPDITLCNANPFTSNRNLSKDSTTLAEYFRLVERATACDETCTKDDGVALNHIREEILSTDGYFHYIGHQNAKHLGHSRESFFAYCVLDMEGVMNGYRIPCFPTANVIEIQHPMFFNCYKIRTPVNEFPDTMYKGFRAVLHLDDYEAVHEEQSLLRPDEDSGQMRGVWVFVHEHSTSLRVHVNRLLLQPGHFHDIPVKMSLRTHLPRSHGNCLDMDREDYDPYMCYANCIQGPISLTIFPSQFKCDGNFILLSSK